MRVLAIVAILCLLASPAFGAVKYAYNAAQTVAAPRTAGTPAANLGTATQLPPIGSAPEQAIEWFRYDAGAAGATSCWTTWANGAAVCGVLPGPADDVVLGISTGVATAGTSYTVAQSLYFTFNSVRLWCLPTNAAATTTGCDGMNNAAALPAGYTSRINNANISTLKIQTQVTALTAGAQTLYPVIFTGYARSQSGTPVAPVAGVAGGGTYDPISTTTNTLTIIGSTFLNVYNGVFIYQPNSAIYGSGYGLNLGGVKAPVDLVRAGNRAFSAQSVYSTGGQAVATPRTGPSSRAGARSANYYLDTTEALFNSGVNGAAAVADGGYAAYNAGYSFVLSTPSIYVNPCAYTGAGRLCTAYAATEIQGPNLVIQPTNTTNFNFPDVPGGFYSEIDTKRRVNITIDAGSILFTTSTTYINADFRLLTGAILAFCEPSKRASATATSFAFSNDPVEGGPATYASTDTGANSYTNRANALASCSPIASANYDWFGTSFTTVRIFNAEDAGNVLAGVNNILYSEIIPNYAKIVNRFGATGTLPVLGNISIAINAFDVPFTRPSAAQLGAAAAQTNGAVGALGAGALATGPQQPNYAGGLAPQRLTTFLGFSNAVAGSYDLADIALVESFDCANFITTADAVTGEEGVHATQGNQCQGLPIPTRFTFFGGVATFIRGATAQTVPTNPGRNTYQLFALDQHSLIVAGDGNQLSTIQFGSVSGGTVAAPSTATAWQIAGQFGARSNGVISFITVPVVLSNVLDLVSATARKLGQPFFNLPSVPAAPSATVQTQISTAQPDQRVLQTLVTPTLTCVATLATVSASTNAGGTCTAGTYSYLYTIPLTQPTTAAPAATDNGVPVSDRRAVIQIRCTNSQCGVAATDVAIVDVGCYTTAFTGTIVTANPPAGSGISCVDPPTFTVASGAEVPSTSQAFPQEVSFSGLQKFPSSAVSANATVGEVQLNTFTTVQTPNVSITGTIVRARPTGTIAVLQFKRLAETSLINEASNVIVNAYGILAADNGGLIRTDPASVVTVNNLGSLQVLNGGILAGGNVATTGATALVSFVGATNTLGAAGNPTVLSGTGYTILAGTTNVVGAVSSAIANTSVTGVVDFQGTYTQTAGAITVQDAAIVGTSNGVGEINLNGGNLVFAAPATGVAGSGAFGSATGGAARLFVRIFGNSSRVLVNSGATFRANVATTILGVTNSTVQQVQIAGTAIFSAVSTITADVLVSQGGSLTTSALTNILTLAGNTTVTQATFGSAVSRFNIGSASTNGTLLLQSATVGGQIDLSNGASIVNQGSSTIAAVTAVAPAAGAVAATTTTTTTGGVLAFFNQGTLTVNAPFTSTVDFVASAGSVLTVTQNQTFTIPAANVLRLRSATVNGAGTVTLNGNTFVESGTNSLVPTNLVNNGVINVALGATLILTTCLSGSGSIVGNGQVIFQSGSPCVSSTGVSTVQNTQVAQNSTIGGGLLIITGAISGPGSITTSGAGLISINNNPALTLNVLSSVGIGSATAAQDAVVLSGTITSATATAVLNLGAATTGRRPTTSPYTPVDTCVTVNLVNGNINLLSTLVISTCTVFTASGTIVGNAGSNLNVYGELTIAPAGLTVNGPAINLNGTLSGSGTLTLAGLTVLRLMSGAIVKGGVTVTGGSIVANGAFVLAGNATFNSPLLLTGSIVVPSNVTLVLNGLVVCNNQASITANNGGRVVINGAAVGCLLSGDVFSGTGTIGSNGTIVNSPLSGLIILTLPGFTISASSNVTVVGPTRFTCNGGTVANPCIITVLGFLYIPFQYVCYDLIGTNPSNAAIASCALGGVFSTTANVRLFISGNGRLVLISGGFLNRQLQPADQFTAPIATVGSLVLGPQSTTVVQATGNQINPTIVINSLVLGGALIVNTQSFVPLHPTVLFRSLNGPVSGAFSSVVINYDTDRSQHPWAYNLGFPTVRVVNRDVVLDPNGNGTNGASGVVPSFVVALFAVLAAFLFRN